jgi:chromatin remodeling complex protein RSC6
LGFNTILFVRKGLARTKKAPLSRDRREASLGESRALSREHENIMADTAPKKPNGLQKVLQPSKELSAIVGSAPLSRGDVVSKMWAYIKQHKLQDPTNKREIVADDKLKPVFGGKAKVDMFEMNKHLAKHLS